MKYLLPLSILSGFLCTHMAAAQITVIDSLKANDTTLRNPFSPFLVTTQAFQQLTFRNVVTIGGLNIKQGQSVGSSLTVDDKGASITISKTPHLLSLQEIYRLPEKKDKKDKDSTIVVPANSVKPVIVHQFTVKAASEDGLVSLFSGGEYQKTLGAGYGIQLFSPIRAKYQERSKKDLQWNYWNQRNKDSTAWRDLYQPQMRETWCDSSRRAICKYMKLWHALQNKYWSKGYYNSDFLVNQYIKYATNPSDVIFMRKYLAAEHDVRLFLPLDWDTGVAYQKADGEALWLKSHFENLSTCDEVGDAFGATEPVVKDSKFFEDEWRIKIAPLMQRHSLFIADSLQKAATWESLRLHWFSINALLNTVELPFFNPSGGMNDFVRKQRNSYLTGQLVYNWLYVGRRNNLYLNLGSSFDYRRQLDPTTMQTYEQVIGQHTGIDSVRVVEQQKLYAEDPGNKAAWAALFGLTYYNHSAVEWGLSVNASQKFLHSHQKSVTVGAFTPVRAGETTVMVMPLVRWDSQGTPHRWSVGISLSTSIPAYARAKPN